MAVGATSGVVVDAATGAAPVSAPFPPWAGETGESTPATGLTMAAARAGARSRVCAGALPNLAT